MSMDITLFWPLVSVLFDIVVVSATKCYKDKTLGDAFESNVYECEIGGSTECCEVDQQFTCCEPEGSHTLEQQFVLWGTIFGIVAFISFLWICYRKDTYMCEGLSLSARCKIWCKCCSRHAKKSGPNDDEAEDAEPNVPYSSLANSRGFEPIANTSLHQNIAYNERDHDSDSGRGSAVQSEANSPSKNFDPRAENIEMADFGQRNETEKKGNKAKKRSKKLIEHEEPTSDVHV
ncbi:hypothetical protein CAPTEDRAFT_223189 [Capitella teleta]|uniref:Vesicular, overexpressed in cancer, prosurvival protein 1 n=1 Tax=Capitella teleta TaxID=283909 RepID=R7T3W6_CAPTE|nr:hypothetical protein CAPTEDRAFT_223189 [Capitella teleta]|eukprot:ELT87468.1 hypothetical protein CAPTEDRAFT_223189 [Capitella teleta]